MIFPYNIKLLLRIVQLKFLSFYELCFCNSISEKPQVYYINTRTNAAINKAIKATGFFIPSRWAPGPYSQMLYSSIFYKSKYPYTRREEVVLYDGVKIYLDWKEHSQNTDTTPIIVICHGISGDSGSCFSRKVSDALYERKLRPVVFNRRGHNKATISSGSVYPWHTDTRDIHDVATYLKSTYPNALLYIIGTSAGGNVMLKYLGEYVGKHPFKAAYASSSAFDLEALYHHYKTNRFASAMLALCMLTMLDERMACTQQLLRKQKLSEKINVKQLFKHCNIWELEEQLVIPFYPDRFKDIEDFYRQSSCHKFLDRVDIPTMLLNSKDDVLIAPELISHAITASQKNQNIVSLVTNQGSHCGWVSNDDDGWEIKLICNYIDSTLSIS